MIAHPENNHGLSATSEPVVLVIDDEAGLRNNLRYALEDHGYEVMTAKEGREGVEFFRRSRPDIVLLDMLMPDMDGLQVLEVISKESPDTPVVMISATGVISLVVEAIRLGAWDFILKPVQDITIVLHSITTNLQRAELIRNSKACRENFEEQLEARTAELKASNRAASDLLARVSGAMRASLREIVGLVESLKRAGLGDEQRAQAEAVLRECGALGRLADEMDDFTG